MGGEEVTSGEGFQPISAILPSILKEISRRVELRGRLEAERGRPLNDEEFLSIAKLDGIEL
jgi:hypothetical protein